MSQFHECVRYHGLPAVKACSLKSHWIEKHSCFAIFESENQMTSTNDLIGVQGAQTVVWSVETGTCTIEPVQAFSVSTQYALRIRRRRPAL